MPSRSRNLEATYERATDGFEALTHGVWHLIRDVLRNVAHTDNWDEARRELGIYDVSWRVKSFVRLMQKIKGLRKEGKRVNAKNFHAVIPDIIGLRVVCLHPSDILRVAVAIKDCCDGRVLRRPTSPHKPFRVRCGDFTLLDLEKFKKAGFSIEKHDSGYSSIHFVYRPGKRFFQSYLAELKHGGNILTLESCGVPWIDCLVEIQLRTILEEAWGEVDHWIRYVDEDLLKDNEMRQQFRAMASYVQACNHHLKIIRDLAEAKLEFRSKKKGQKQRSGKRSEIEATKTTNGQNLVDYIRGKKQIDLNQETEDYLRRRLRENGYDINMLKGMEVFKSGTFDNFKQHFCDIMEREPFKSGSNKDNLIDAVNYMNYWIFRSHSGRDTHLREILERRKRW